MERRTGTRLVMYSLGAIIAPYLTLSIFLVVTEWLKDFLFPGASLYVGIGLSIVSGAVFIFPLHLKPLVRALVLVLYIALQAYFLFWYMFEFVCIVYDECL